MDKQEVELSIIISVYKNTEALTLIFKSIQQQHFEGSFEVIIAEDNNGEEMLACVNEAKLTYSFAITHLVQPDIGFRKCRILNEAIRVAKADFLVFIDGDCLLHPQFLKQHVLLKKPGSVFYGRRVMLSESFTDVLLKSKDLKKISYLNLIKYKCKRLDAAWFLPYTSPKRKIGFWGHNWAIHKSDIQLVKGFDEGYQKAGIGEDTDIEWRLQEMGIQFFRMKNRVVQYHLWHTENYPDTQEVQDRLAGKKELLAIGNKNILFGNL